MVKLTFLPPWEDPRGGEISRAKLDNGIIEIEILSLGGIIRSLSTPDKNGQRSNIVLGCDSAEDYLAQTAHLGAIAGRFANRIANGAFMIDNQRYSLSTNQGTNCLHGGQLGFNQKNWQMSPLEDGIRLTLKSPDGDMGFPGNCQVQLDYRLDKQDLYVEMSAKVDKTCPVSLTQHSYFNLDGSDNHYQHTLQVNAKQYLQMNEQGIPTAILATHDTAFDLAQEKPMQALLYAEETTATSGIDHCFLVDGSKQQLNQAASISSAISGRRLTLYTNQPSVQIYGANFLAGTIGSKGQRLKQHQAICLEPQQVPDAPNQPHIAGSAFITPDEEYRHISRYHFDNI